MLVVFIGFHLKEQLVGTHAVLDVEPVDEVWKMTAS
jgi:hypothetical protein